MEFINNRVGKYFFAFIVTVLISLVLLGQLTVRMIATDFKIEMITHDYEVAGYINRNDLDHSQYTNAFIANKNDEDLMAGQVLLQTKGYHDSIQNSLIPEVESFQHKYEVLFLIVTVVFSIAIFSLVLIFVIHHNEKLRGAEQAIRKFMDGDVRIRLDDHEEGSLSKLFTAVNVMATSLTSHIEKEKQNKEFLRETISDISHQLKTPLAALQMYNEIIQDEDTGNDVVDSFTIKSKNELMRMEYLIQNLLKLARLDANMIQLEKNNQNLKGFLEKSISRFRTRADLEDKVITLKCDHQITLHCDENWLMEAVCNIIKNALDHTASKDRIELLCDETSVMIRITIIDNGNGIHPEDIHHIFKRFYRSRFSKDKQGVGIGLTLSKSIVEKHGGSIMVESELGKGTTFHLAFPKLTNL